MFCSLNAHELSLFLKNWKPQVWVKNLLKCIDQTVSLESAVQDYPKSNRRTYTNILFLNVEFEKNEKSMFFDTKMKSLFPFVQCGKRRIRRRSWRDRRHAWWDSRKENQLCSDRRPPSMRWLFSRSPNTMQLGFSPRSTRSASTNLFSDEYLVLNRITHEIVRN